MTKISLLRWAVLCCSFAALAEEDDPLVEEKPLAQLVKQLRSENRGLQLRGAQSLSAAPAHLHARIVPRVIPVLKSERENDKFVAAQVLGSYGPAAQNAVRDLLPLLEGTQFERNRAAAAKALGQILKDAQPSSQIDQVTANLIQVFEDRYEDVRREAVTACGMIGPAAQACIPHLTKRLNEQIGYPPNQVALAAAWTCGRMGPLAKEHVDLLITLLHRVQGHTPAYISALGCIGPVQENIVPNILDNMEQCVAHLEAWQVMQKFGPKAEQVIPFARRCLRDPYLPAREKMAIEVLKFLQVAGPKAVEALPEVEGALHWPKTFQDAPAPLKLMREEALKTAGILKGLPGTQKVDKR